LRLKLLLLLLLLLWILPHGCMLAWRSLIIEPGLRMSLLLLLLLLLSLMML
jgi:hypothetical protein